jgi:hypothetical protein
MMPLGVHKALGDGDGELLNTKKSAFERSARLSLRFASSPCIVVHTLWPVRAVSDFADRTARRAGQKMAAWNERPQRSRKVDHGNTADGLLR